MLIHRDDIENWFIKAQNHYKNENFKEALSIFTIIASQYNHTGSQYYLGLIYEHGKDVPPDNEYALIWYKRAGYKYKLAQYCIANLYFNLGKQGTVSNYTMALIWFKKSLDCSQDQEPIDNESYSKALYKIGYIYKHALGVERNNTAAFEWFTKAAIKGHSFAQYETGFSYYNGIGIKQDHNLAILWFQKSVDNDHYYLSQFYLGLIYSSEHFVNKDFIIAFKWYLLSANQNYSKAQVAVGICYRDGKGVLQDYKEAMKFFEKAVNNDGNVQAQVFIAHLYYQALGVDKNDVLAFKSYKKAARQGDHIAQYHLGVMFYHGQGTRKDYNEAMKWFEMSALSESYSPSQYSIGLMYAKGYGVLKDHLFAYQWYQLAAKQKHSKAQIKIADEYMNQKDYKLAIIWYQRALENDENARSRFCIGEMYMQGLGVDQNNIVALKWYKMAANQGYYKAQIELGSYYFHKADFQQHYDEALFWYQKAANNSDDNGEAYYHLGYLYSNLIGVKKDYAIALMCYEKAANMGIHIALYQVGLIYYEGVGVEQSYSEAMKWFQKSVDNDEYALSLYYIGLMHWNGYDVEKNLEVGFQWFLRAAYKNDYTSQVQVGDCYRNEMGVKRDYKQALFWYQKAMIKDKNAHAQYYIGIIYNEGLEVEKNPIAAFQYFKIAGFQGHYISQIIVADHYNEERDYKRAFCWYHKAANSYDVTGRAHYQIGFMYYYGLGIEKDYIDSLEWYKKAGNLGHVYAQHQVGKMFYYGIGVEQVYSEAILWFKKSGNNDNYFLSQYLIGSMYWHGHGVEKDYTVALEFYLKAANQNCPKAQFEVGNCYSSGLCGPQNFRKSMIWYQKSVNNEQNPEVQYRIGQMYFDGLGVRPSARIAIQWFKKSADQGNSLAQVQIGNIYYNGVGIRQNYKEAMNWYLKADDNDNNAIAQFKIGYMYSHRIGVIRDHSVGFKWYLKSAKQGNIDAQYEIGEAYYKGCGTKKDLCKAVFWFRKAIDKDDENFNIKYTNLIAQIYYKGCRDLEENYSLALKYYLKSARKGDKTALKNIELFQCKEISIAPISWKENAWLENLMVKKSFQANKIDSINALKKIELGRVFYVEATLSDNKMKSL